MGLKYVADGESPDPAIDRNMLEEFVGPERIQCEDNDAATSQQSLLNVLQEMISTLERIKRDVETKSIDPLLIKQACKIGKNFSKQDTLEGMLGVFYNTSVSGRGASKISVQRITRSRRTNGQRGSDPLLPGMKRSAPSTWNQTNH